MTPASRRRCQLSSEQNTKNERYAAQHIQAHTLISRPRGAHMCMHTCRRARCAARAIEAAWKQTFQVPAGRLDGGGSGSKGAPLYVRTKHPFKFLASFLSNKKLLSQREKCPL